MNRLLEGAAENPRLWLLCGDVGYSVLEGFAARFPGRFVNAGVSEQNMIGVAAGLASAGNSVVVYSIANFLVMRAFEQIRNDICYHNLDVKIVAVGAGFAYGPAGYSHHAIEDLGVMRLLPNIAILAPGDPVETGMAVDAMLRRRGPCYLRLGRQGQPAVHRFVPRLQFGSAILVREGCDVALLSAGGLLPEAISAADRLASLGISARLLSVPCLKPADKHAITAAARICGRVLTIEDHGAGGLGTVAAEILAEAGLGSPLVSLRVFEAPLVAGSESYLRERAGLTMEAVVAAALKLCAAPVRAPSERNHG
jgi:transketolase